jgi:hypothetical protein
VRTQTGIQGTWRILGLSSTGREKSVQATRNVKSFVYSCVPSLLVAGDCCELPAEQLLLYNDYNEILSERNYYYYYYYLGF